MLKQRLLTVAVVLPLLLACIFLLPNPRWALLMTVPRRSARLNGRSSPGTDAALARCSSPWCSPVA